jgi:hypothetical protein
MGNRLLVVLKGNCCGIVVVKVVLYKSRDL